MSKKKTIRLTQSQSPLSFMDFWLLIAYQLGNSHIKLNPHAKTIADFINPSSDAKDHLKSAIKESYKRSRCKHLKDQISINIVLDILGETAYNLQHDKRDDLFDIELLEEIAWHISDRYKHHLQLNVPTPQKNKKAKLVSLPDYKIRLANTKT